MPLTVEFLGIPGSGKSTLATRVEAELRASGVEAISIGEAVKRGMSKGVGDKLIDPLMALMPRRIKRRFAERAFMRSRALFLSTVQFAVPHPGAMAAFFDGQARRAELEVGSDMVVTWFLQLVAQYQFAISTSVANEILLLDEGFCQRVLTGFAHRFSSDDHHDVEKYLASIPRPDLLVYFAPDVDIVSERLEIGTTYTDPFGWSPITKRLHYSGIDSRQFLEDCARCVEFVVETAERAGWALLRVDTSDSVEAASLKVLTLMSPDGLRAGGP